MITTTDAAWRIVALEAEAVRHRADYARLLGVVNALSNRLSLAEAHLVVLTRARMA